MKLESANQVNNITIIKYSQVCLKTIIKFLSNRGLNFEEGLLLKSPSMYDTIEWKNSDFTYRWVEVLNTLEIHDKK